MKEHGRSEAARLAEEFCQSDHCYGCYHIYEDQNQDEAKCPLTKHFYQQVRQALQLARRQGIEEARREALRHVHAEDPMGNLLAWLHRELEDKA